MGSKYITFVKRFKYKGGLYKVKFRLHYTILMANIHDIYSWPFNIYYNIISNLNANSVIFLKKYQIYYLCQNIRI